MVNNTWEVDGEFLYVMGWAALTFGGAGGWEAGEANIDNFKDAYDWTFYRNNDSSFRDALNSLDQAHEALAKLGIREDTDDLFWADPFTAEGAKLMQSLSPAARGLCLGAEHTLEAL